MEKIYRSSSDLTSPASFYGDYIKKNGNDQDHWEAGECRCWFEGRMGIGCLRILDLDRKVF
jgi:hypothetical protein